MPREDSRVYLLPEFCLVYIVRDVSDGDVLVIRTFDEAVVDRIDVGELHPN